MKKKVNAFPGGHIHCRYNMSHLEEFREAIWTLFCTVLKINELEFYFLVFIFT